MSTVNIIQGSDKRLIFRVKELETGEIISILKETTSFDYILKGIRLFLMDKENNVFKQYAVNYGFGGDYEYDNIEPDERSSGDWDKIYPEDLSHGIFSIKMQRAETINFKPGAYFGRMNLVFVRSGYAKNLYYYTIPDYPIYLGEIVSDEVMHV